MRSALALMVLAAACGPDLKTAGGAAAAFADRYYVESNIQEAAALTVGLAKARLEKERSLAGEARDGRGNSAPPQAMKSRVYYERGAVEVMGDRAVVSFKLRIQPPENGAAFEKSAMLTLTLKDGRWFVADIAESTTAQ